MKKLITLTLIIVSSITAVKAQNDTLYNNKNKLKDCEGIKDFLVLRNSKDQSITIKFGKDTTFKKTISNNDLKIELKKFITANFNISCSTASVSAEYQELIIKLPDLIVNRITQIKNPYRVLPIGNNYLLSEILTNDFNYTYSLIDVKNNRNISTNVPILTYKIDTGYVFEIKNIKANTLFIDSIGDILQFINQNQDIDIQPKVYIQVDGPKNNIVFNKTETDTITIDSKLADKLRGEAAKISIGGLSGNFYKIKFPGSSTTDTKKITNIDDNAPATIADIKKIISSTLENVAAEKGFAASVELKREFITLHLSKEECECSSGVQQYKAGTKLLKIDSVKFVTYNNTIYQIDIVGTVDGKQIQTITNNGWGFRLGALMTGAGSVTVKINETNYYLQYCELFYVRPTKDNVILYNIKDATYRLKPTEKVLLARKDLLDFMSASAFVDLFGLNKTSTNSPITGELYMAFYLNHARRNWVRTLNLTTTITSDAFGSKDNFLETQFINKNQFNYRAIDLLKNINFSFKPLLNIYTFDIKPANMLLEINTGTQIIGSNVKQVYVTDKFKTDSTVYNNLYSYTGVFQARFKVTEPDSRFGFDLQINYLTGYNLFNSTFKGLRGDHPLAELTAADFKSGLGNILDVDFNIFIHPEDPKSNTNKGGFYIKTHFSKAIGYQNGFFALLVGYSTDIQNFFK